MTDDTRDKKGLATKIKTGALIGCGCVLLWFLIANLWTPPWKLSLWPIAYLEAPGTLFIFLFLVLGGVLGFVTCFLLLRSGRLDDAILKLVEARKMEEERREKPCDAPAGEPGAGGGAAEGGKK